MPDSSKQANAKPIILGGLRGLKFNKKAPPIRGAAAAAMRDSAVGLIHDVPIIREALTKLLGVATELKHLWTSQDWAVKTAYFEAVAQSWVVGSPKVVKFLLGITIDARRRCIAANADAPMEDVAKAADELVRHEDSLVHNNVIPSGGTKRQIEESGDAHDARNALHQESFNATTGTMSVAAPTAPAQLIQNDPRKNTEVESREDMRKKLISEVTQRLRVLTECSKGQFDDIKARLMEMKEDMAEGSKGQFDDVEARLMEMKEDVTTFMEDVEAFLENEEGI